LKDSLNALISSLDAMSITTRLIFFISKTTIAFFSMFLVVVSIFYILGVSFLEVFILLSVITGSFIFSFKMALFFGHKPPPEYYKHKAEFKKRISTLFPHKEEEHVFNTKDVLTPDMYIIIREGEMAQNIVSPIQPTSYIETIPPFIDCVSYSILQDARSMERMA
jgi:hypothetical protein